MALAHWQRTFTDTAGNIQANISVTIRNESTGAIAAIFTDSAGGTPKANPFTTDSFGYGDFYAADGRYRIQATGIDWRNEEVITFENIAAAVQDAEDAAQAAALNAGIYADTTEGLANTVDGDYFSTPAAGAEEYLTLYRNDAGVATEIDTYPNKTAIDTVTEALDKRTIYVGSVAELEALSPVEGAQINIVGTDEFGKTDTVQFFKVVAAAEGVLLANGLYAKPMRLQADRLRVGNAAAPSSTWERDAVLVSKNLEGLTDTHGFTDYTFIDNITDSGTYGAFDAKTRMDGSRVDPINHMHGFQDRQIFEGQNLVVQKGFYSRPEFNAGNTGTRYGMDVYDPVGAGALSQNYGVRIQPLEKGASINQAFRSEGTTPNSFGGPQAVGSVGGVTNIGPNLSMSIRIAGDSLTGATQYGTLVNVTANSECTVFQGQTVSPEAGDGATLSQCIGFRATDLSLVGSGSAAVYAGFWVNDLSAAGQNIGYYSQVSEGADKFGLAIVGTAQNVIRGKTYFGGGTSSVPAARVHIAPGAATAGEAPLKLSSGTNLTTPENGAFEFDGTNLYFTVAGVRKIVNLT